MKHWCLLLVLLAFAAGCKTTSVETRRQERYSAYSSLTPEQRTLADQGKIAIGMPMDAVYIAWGKPSQVITGQTEQGTSVTWIYTGTTWQEYRFWNYRYHHYSGRRGHYVAYPETYLEYDYIPRSYVAAEVTFENGVVKRWRNLTAPPGY